MDLADLTERDRFRIIVGMSDPETLSEFVNEPDEVTRRRAQERAEERAERDAFYLKPPAIQVPNAPETTLRAKTAASERARFERALTVQLRTWFPDCVDAEAKASDFADRAICAGWQHVDVLECPPDWREPPKKLTQPQIDAYAAQVRKKLHDARRDRPGPVEQPRDGEGTPKQVQVAVEPGETAPGVSGATP